MVNSVQRRNEDTHCHNGKSVNVFDLLKT